MGSAASVTNGGRDNFDKYGDRIEVTKSFPVGSFGRDNTNSVARSGQNGEKTLTSSGSISEEKVRERSSSKQSKSRRSLGSFLGFNSKIKSEECERAQSDGNLHSDEMPEFELTRLMKKNNELQQEKERHKRELESLRKGKTKWQNNCLKAEEDVVQAKERARAFEDELERVKKQFKSYSDEKEKELHSLVKRIRELENNLRSCTSGENSSLYAVPEGVIASFESDADVENLSLFKAPGSLVDEKVPDFNTIFPLLAQVMTNLQTPNKNRTFRFFLSTDREATRDATFFVKVLFPQLQQLCAEKGKFLIMLESYGTHNKKEERDDGWESHLVSKCDLFFGMLGNSDNRSVLGKWRNFYQIFNTRRRPMFFCFKDGDYNASSGTELTHFLDSVGEETKVSFYSQATNLVEENNEAIQDIVREHFGLDTNHSVKRYCSMDISDEELISDCDSSLKQLDILRMLSMSTDSEVGFEKYYDQLDEYVRHVSPFPPILVVSGAAGSGKTTLLAKWITRQLACGENLVLYNFVGGTTSDVFTNPAYVIRRLTAQLLGLFPCLCSMLHCDPVKCEEYFPKLLKTIPAKVSTNIVIVIDAADKLQNANSTHHLNWLNELLPATVRVVLSVTTGNELSHSRSWKTINLSPLAVEESRDVLASCWKNPDIKLDNGEASEILNNLNKNAITSPLFLTMLSHELSSASNIGTDICEYASFKDVIEMTLSTLKTLENSKGSITNEILALICCSRSGLAEAELMDILSLQWSEWELVIKCLIYDRPILCEVNDLICVSHEQILEAIFVHLNNDDGLLRQSRERLVKYYTGKLKSNGVTVSIVDQLPWLLLQLDDKENLQNVISRVDVFHMFFKRSLFSDLLGYWQYLDVETATFGKMYMDAMRKQEVDTPCLEIALRYENLGRFLKGIGLFSLAMKCLERGLEMKEMVLETDDPWVGQSLHHLADLYVLLGNLESAEASYKQTLAINENTLGKDHPLVAKELECLAHVKKKQNKERACTELERKAARIRRKSALPRMSMMNSSFLAQRNPSVAFWSTLLTATLVYLQIDPVSITKPGHQHSSSTSLDCRLIQVNNLGAGRKSPEIASSLHNLGVLMMMEKRYQDAETLFKKSLAMRESLFGGKDLVVAQSLDRLAALYYNWKMYADSITCHKKSLAIKLEKLDKGDPNLISTMDCLAIALRRNGNLEASESTYRKVLMVLKEKHDAKNPMIATALHNLAVINSDQEKLDEALALFEQALAIYEESLGGSHPKVAESLRNIAKVHLDLGNSEEASSYLLRSQMIDQDGDFTSSSLNSCVSWINNSTLELVDC